MAHDYQRVCFFSCFAGNLCNLQCQAKTGTMTNLSAFNFLKEGGTVFPHKRIIRIILAIIGVMSEAFYKHPAPFQLGLQFSFCSDFGLW